MRIQRSRASRSAWCNCLHFQLDDCRGSKQSSCASQNLRSSSWQVASFIQQISTELIGGKDNRRIQIINTTCRILVNGTKAGNTRTNAGLTQNSCGKTQTSNMLDQATALTVTTCLHYEPARLSCGFKGSPVPGKMWPAAGGADEAPAASNAGRSEPPGTSTCDMAPLEGFKRGSMALSAASTMREP